MKNHFDDVAPTSFLNVQVTAIPQIDSAGKVSYQTTFNPESLTVTDPDTVINYQLIDPTPADVQFSKLSIKPDGSNQFSVPTISESGKLVTFSDANTVRAKFNITIKFTDKDKQEFSVDPELENEPKRLEQESQRPVMLMSDPETENEPKR